MLLWDHSNVCLPHIHQQDTVFGDEVTIILVIGGAEVRHPERTPDVPAEHLFDDGAHVRKQLAISVLWKSLGPDDCVEFGLGLFLHCGVE